MRLLRIAVAVAALVLASCTTGSLVRALAQGEQEQALQLARTMSGLDAIITHNNRVVSGLNRYEYGGKVEVTPLLAAVMVGDLEVARILLERGASPDLANSSGLTPLMVAAGALREDLVDLLLAKGADAARTGYTNTVSAALTGVEEGTSGWARSRESAEQTAARHALRARLARKLLEAAGPRLPMEQWAQTIHAVSEPEVVKLLLEWGVPADWTDDGGRTPLSRAVPSFNLETAKLLLAAGANPNWRQRDNPELGLFHEMNNTLTCRREQPPECQAMAALLAAYGNVVTEAERTRAAEISAYVAKLDAEVEAYRAAQRAEAQRRAALPRKPTLLEQMFAGSSERSYPEAPLVTCGDKRTACGTSCCRLSDKCCLWTDNKASGLCVATSSASDNPASCPWGYSSR